MFQLIGGMHYRIMNCWSSSDNKFISLAELSLHTHIQPTVSSQPNSSMEIFSLSQSNALLPITATDRLSISSHWIWMTPNHKLKWGDKIWTERQTENTPIYKSQLSTKWNNEWLNIVISRVFLGVMWKWKATEAEKKPKRNNDEMKKREGKGRWIEIGRKRRENKRFSRLLTGRLAQGSGFVLSRCTAV